MSKHPYWHLLSPKSALRLSVIITGLVSAFPTVLDAARAGGGTTTTMVLTYTFGAPPRWVMRVDPLTVVGFQLDVMFDPARAHLDTPIGTNGVVFKFPFTQGPLPDFATPGFIKNIHGAAEKVSPGDVDIFELVFIDDHPGLPIDNVQFKVFASSDDFIIGFDPITGNNVQNATFGPTEIALTTRSIAPGSVPHIWDPDTGYDNGTTGGTGAWNTSSNSWDDLPSAPQPLVNTPWNNATHANDLAVFGGNPGSGIVTVAVPISVGGFQFDISGYNIQGGTLTLAAPSGLTPKIDTGANNATISSTITGSGGLTKVGTGTLVLTGANTYSGGTAVNAGTLLVNSIAGSGTANGAVMVNNSGCVLGGTGTIGGSVNVTSGAMLLGGNGASASGALTVGNALNLNAGSIIQLALGTAGVHSTLNRTGGTWTFAPNQAFMFIDRGVQPGLYDNIITGLASDPGGTAYWTINNAGFVGTFNYDGAGHIDLVLTSVPCAPGFVTEIEPNNMVATAQSLAGTQVRVRGDLYQFPLPVAGDEDYYSFSATAGDRVYAATMTSFSGGSGDTRIDLIASNGTTILETDDDDGSFVASSSSIAGAIIHSTGTYYLKVRPANMTLGGTVRPYDLYLRVQSSGREPEAEPNDLVGGTPNPLPSSGWTDGTISSAGDNDTFSFTANAGDTIYASVDANPTYDAAAIWNPRLGIGIFNNNILFADDASVTSRNSEAMFITVQQSGTYMASVDTVAGSGGRYHLSVSVFPGDTCRTCNIYAGAGGAITDMGTTDFTLNIPEVRTVGNLRLNLNSTHTRTADLDVSLISPDGNEVVLFDDPTTNAGAGAPQINCALDDEAATPISSFTIYNGMNYQPESYARLGYFNGMQSQGMWKLRIRDDVTGNAGTLNSWSLSVCSDPPLGCAGTPATIYQSDFETNAGGFTHSGTQDEWGRGLPSAGSAPITTCHSGGNCWKTDLAGGYNASSNQDLVSPAINLTGVTGSSRLTWWQKFQFESASADTAWVEVREVGNPANFKKVWEWKGATQTRNVGNPLITVQMSAGWGQMKADISSFNGKMVEVRFHLESDVMGQFSGLAIDDVAVTMCTPGPPLQLTSAGSRKAHGGAGSFDVPLPLSGQFGVECRSGGGNYSLVFTFTNPVVDGSASVVEGIGSVLGSPVFAGNTMTVNLTGVTNQQLITVRLSGVMDSFTQVLPNTVVSVYMLIGDTSGNKSVNATDVSQTKVQSGFPVTNGNFREDVTVSGTINGSDVSLVKLRVGSGIPEPD